MQLSNILKPVC